MACPEVYKTDEQQFAYVEQEDVPKGLEEKARRGAEECPEGAVIVVK
jgi:ferredoxin